MLRNNNKEKKVQKNSKINRNTVLNLLELFFFILYNVKDIVIARSFASVT